MKRFWIFALALLVWNVAGLAAFVTQFRSNPNEMADPVSAHAFAAMPSWAWIAYAVATIGGSLGAVALLLRLRSAWMLFAVSLIGVVAQFSWSIFGFGIIDYKGFDALVLPAAITMIALFGMVFAYERTAQGRPQDAA